MLHGIRNVVGALLFAAVLTGASTARGDDAPAWPSRTDAEAHARELDHRVVELQHAIMAARHTGDQAGLERAEADLKKVQADRVQVLRTLGELR